MAAGFDGFRCKPISVRDLLETIRRGPPEALIVIRSEPADGPAGPPANAYFCLATI